MMFPVDYQVNVHAEDGVRRYTLLENQDDRYLVVLEPQLVKELQAYTRRGGKADDGLIALLAEEAVVIDRQRGDVLGERESQQVMSSSKHSAIQRAALYRTSLPERPLPLTGEDLAWSFALEVAKRRGPAV